MRILSSFLDLIFILKLQKNIKLSENIIVNLLTLSLKKMIYIKQKIY